MLWIEYMARAMSEFKLNVIGSILFEMLFILNILK